jgi:hypothetical protein
MRPDVLQGLELWFNGVRRFAAEAAGSTKISLQSNEFFSIKVRHKYTSLCVHVQGCKNVGQAAGFTAGVS